MKTNSDQEENFYGTTSRKRHRRAVVPFQILEGNSNTAKRPDSLEFEPSTSNVRTKRMKHCSPKVDSDYSKSQKVGKKSSEKSKLSAIAEKEAWNGIGQMQCIFNKDGRISDRKTVDETIAKYKEMLQQINKEHTIRVTEELDNDFAAWLDEDPLEMEAKVAKSSNFCFADILDKERLSDKNCTVIEDQVIKGKVEKKTVEMPCTRIESGDTVPDMNYYVPLEMSINGCDAPRLSHMPFFDDDQEDKELFEQFVGLFPDGVHGFAHNAGPVDDYQLYCLFRQALEDFRKTRGENPDLVYYCIYRLLPNKFSQRELTEKFPWLCRRFAEEGFDSFSLEPWKQKPVQKVAPNLQNVTCYACIQYACPIHGVRLELPAKFPNGQYYKAILPLRETDEHDFCSENCWKHIEQDEIKFLHPTSEEMSARAATVYFSKATVLRTPIEDGSFLVSLYEDRTDRENSFCSFIASVLKPFMIDTKITTCREAYEFLLKLSERPSAGKLALSQTGKRTRARDYMKRSSMFRREQENYGRIRIKEKFDKEIAEALAKGLDTSQLKEECKRAIKNVLSDFKLVAPLTSCRHEGPCNAEHANCVCRANGVCSHLCECDIDCAQRFPGCECSPGQCGTKTCNCFLANWECSPITCQTCLCEQIDSKGIGCMNNALTRMAHKKTHVAPSKFSGHGLFLLEPCEKDELITEYVGELISNDEAERRGAIYDRYNCSYLFNLPNGAVDSYYTGNNSRFANNCEKNPTMYAKMMVVAGEHRIGLYAKRSLEVNEELTFDYSYTTEHKKVFKRAAVSVNVREVKATRKQSL